MIFGKIHDMQLSREKFELLVKDVYRLREQSLDGSVAQSERPSARRLTR